MCAGMVCRLGSAAVKKYFRNNLINLLNCMEVFK
jgi:hypothetical protein